LSRVFFTPHQPAFCYPVRVSFFKSPSGLSSRLFSSPFLVRCIFLLIVSYSLFLDTWGTSRFGCGRRLLKVLPGSGLLRASYVDGLERFLILVKFISSSSSCLLCFRPTILPLSDCFYALSPVTLGGFSPPPGNLFPPPTAKLGTPSRGPFFSLGRRKLFSCPPFSPLCVAPVMSPLNPFFLRFVTWDPVGWTCGYPVQKAPPHPSFLHSILTVHVSILSGKYAHLVQYVQTAPRLTKPFPFFPFPVCSVPPLVPVRFVSNGVDRHFSQLGSKKRQRLCLVPCRTTPFPRPGSPSLFFLPPPHYSPPIGEASRLFAP